MSFSATASIPGRKRPSHRTLDASADAGGQRGTRAALASPTPATTIPGRDDRATRRRTPQTSRRRPPPRASPARADRRAHILDPRLALAAGGGREHPPPRARLSLPGARSLPPRIAASSAASGSRARGPGQFPAAASAARHASSRLRAARRWHSSPPGEFVAACRPQRRDAVRCAARREATRSRGRGARPRSPRRARRSSSRRPRADPPPRPGDPISTASMVKAPPRVGVSRGAPDLAGAPRSHSGRGDGTGRVLRFRPEIREDMPITRVRKVPRSAARFDVLEDVGPLPEAKKHDVCGSEGLEGDVRERVRLQGQASTSGLQRAELRRHHREVGAEGGARLEPRRRPSQAEVRRRDTRRRQVTA